MRIAHVSENSDFSRCTVETADLGFQFRTCTSLYGKDIPFLGTSDLRLELETDATDNCPVQSATPKPHTRTSVLLHRGCARPLLIAKSLRLLVFLDMSSPHDGALRGAVLSPGMLEEDKSSVEYIKTGVGHVTVTCHGDRWVHRTTVMD